MAELPTGTITFLFTDIEGSTQIWERQPEAMKAALARHDALLRESIKAHGGHVFKTVGDSFCAAFAAAPDALSAALDAQRALGAEKWGATIGTIRVRVALHTGTAEERDGDYFGPPLNRVARLLAAGHGGQILLSRATQELVRDQLPGKASLADLGEHRLKDLFRPERVYQLNAPDLPAEFPPLNTLDARLTNLPAQPTPLIGREREVAAVLSLVRRDDVRLVTLSGPGGTGKTRLSLQVAADLVDEYRHGVFFVALASITDPELVITTIGATLGVSETGGQPIAESVQHFLQEKHLLLVLDNFEQVIKAAPQVGDLLAAAPNLKVIVSSREVLRLRGEHDYPVPPLGLPERGRKQTLAVLSQYESVGLFIQRAKEVRPDFEITDENAPAVAEICVRLDGLPLAIELAAARSRMLTPQAMLEKLSSRLKALTGGPRDLPARQQTLRSAIDWSYDLLDDAEKTLFTRLGVFQGGRSIEAAEAVCGPGLDLDVSDGLESLLNKSLLRQEIGPQDGLRFVMLETIHEYAREKLAENDEAEAIRRRHAEYFTAIVEGAEREIRAGAKQLEWFTWLKAEHGNIRTALEWTLGGADIELGLRLVGAVWPFWWREGYFLEWRQWTEQVDVLSREMPPSVRAGARRALGMMLWANLKLTEAKLCLTEAVEIYRQIDDRYHLGITLTECASASIGVTEDFDQAMTIAEEAITLLRAVGDKGAIAQTINVLGELTRLHGDYDRAARAYEESLAIAVEIGDKVRERMQYANLGFIAMHDGDYQRAENLFRKNMTLSQEMGQFPHVVISLAMIAGIIGIKGQPERAARLIGASDALRESRAIVVEAGDLPDHERGVALVRGQLGEAQFDKLYQEGRSLLLDEAIALALQDGGSDH